MLELFDGIVRGSLVVGVFQLGGIAVSDIDVIVVLLSQSVVMEQGFDLPEGIPQRELIQRKLLKILHELAVQDVFHCNLRHLGQRAALRFRQFPGGTEPGKADQSYPNHHQNTCADGTNFLVIQLCHLLRNGNTGTG